jgi:hypothetical protein
MSDIGKADGDSGRTSAPPSARHATNYLIHNPGAQHPAESHEEAPQEPDQNCIDRNGGDEHRAFSKLLPSGGLIPSHIAKLPRTFEQASLASLLLGLWMALVYHSFDLAGR